MTRRFLPLYFAIVAGCLLAQPRKVQILIITGQDQHPWREAAPYLRGLLEETGKFEVRVTKPGDKYEDAGTIMTQAGAKTHKLYLPAAIVEDKQVRPGTFGVLVADRVR